MVVLKSVSEETEKNVTTETINLKTSSSRIAIPTLYKVKRALKRIEPDIVLSVMPLPGVENYYLLASPLERAIHLFSKEGSMNRELNSLKKGMATARSVIVFTEEEKVWLTDKLNISKEKICVWKGGRSVSLQAAAWEEREKIKEKFTGSNEYFFCERTDDAKVLTEVLKGYSGFKKWQKSNMKLLLRVNSHSRKIVEGLLKNYRFQEEVTLTDLSEEEYFTVLRGAYAILLPEKYYPASGMMFTAFSAEVPVIAAKGSACTDIAAGVVKQFAYQNKEDLARVLLELFRDERERGVLIKEGRLLAEQYFQQNKVNGFQQIILNS